MNYLRVHHSHSGHCGFVKNGTCSSSVHSCSGIKDEALLKRKIKTSNHILAVDEPIYTVSQIKINGTKEHQTEVLAHLNNTSTNGPVEQLTDNCTDVLLGCSRSATYQSLRRAKEGLHFQ